MTDSTKLRQLIAQTMLLCDESAAFQQDPSLAAALTEARQTLASLHKRVQSAEARYSVGVVGLTNVGKSTLLNALFGQELAPRRNGPCTAAPIEFVYGESLTVTAYHFNSIQRPTWNCATVEEVHARLSALADSAGAEQSRIIRKVVVSAPLELLANGLIVCDTPGFGAAQLADAAGSHDEAVKRYLKTDLSQVFWVVLGEQGIGKREKDFHASFFGEICDDIIVTGCEDWEDRDKIRFKKRFSALFCQRMPHFHFVSGLLGHKARLNNDASQLEEAGIPDLERRIKSLSNPVGRNQSIIVAYQQLARDLISWFDEYRLEGHEGELWRSDSLTRFKSFASSADCGQLAKSFYANESQSILAARDANGLPEAQAGASQPTTTTPRASEMPRVSASQSSAKPGIKPIPSVDASLQRKADVLHHKKQRKEDIRTAKRTVIYGFAGIVILYLLLRAAVAIFPPNISEYLLPLYLLSLLSLGLGIGWRLERLIQRCSYILLGSLGVCIGSLTICFLFEITRVIAHLSASVVISSIALMPGAILSALIDKLKKRKAKNSHG